jgi:hypothetical protein
MDEGGSASDGDVIRIVSTEAGAANHAPVAVDRGLPRRCALQPEIAVLIGAGSAKRAGGETSPVSNPSDERRRPTDGSRY